MIKKDEKINLLSVRKLTELSHSGQETEARNEQHFLDFKTDFARQSRVCLFLTGTVVFFGFFLEDNLNPDGPRDKSYGPLRGTVCLRKICARA